jgi:heme/copper-type cytochrome/quinol oxidase subunit 2
MCFSVTASNSPSGTYAGMFVLFAITVGVLLAFAGFAWRLARRAQALAAAPLSSGVSPTGEALEDGLRA